MKLTRPHPILLEWLTGLSVACLGRRGSLVRIQSPRPHFASACATDVQRVLERAPARAPFSSSDAPRKTRVSQPSSVRSTGASRGESNTATGTP